MMGAWGLRGLKRASFHVGFPKYSILSLEMLLVQVCQVQSVLGASKVLVHAAGCMQHLTQLCVQRKRNGLKYPNWLG